MTPCRLLLWQVALRVSCHLVTATLCLGGSDIFTSVRENSPKGQFISDINITVDPGSNTVRLCLAGQNADWFYLEGRSIRLNLSGSRVLDREVQGPILIAELTCYEDDVLQTRFRILVEILNENDNKPIFVEETIRPLSVSELTAVNSVVFTVKAVDPDGDLISYVIDQSSGDAWFFRIDLPNSGKVVLDKPLDYESRTQLQLVMWAQESNTAEKFKVSTELTVDVVDGDDQYPHFLPCTPVSPGVPVCMSPVYTANITRKHQAGILDFSPGPIRAEDGDRGIDAPLVYTILSGDDQGRFVINETTGEVNLTRAVDDRLQEANFTISVVVSQADDRLKYSVASVLVRVLCENVFPPAFNRTTFKGFVIQNSSPASIVSTYGNRVLQMQALDGDFADGVNPNIRYHLHPPSPLYQVTREGVLIGRTDRLHAFDRHILQVIARDEESGEEVSASVDIEVLQRGQTVPRGAFTEQQLFGDVDGRLAGGVAVLILLAILAAVLFVMLQTIRRRQQENPAQHAEASGKLPRVVNPSPPAFMEAAAYHGTAFSHQSGSFHGREGVYTRRPSLPPPPPPHPAPPSWTRPSAPPEVLMGEPVGLRRLQTELFVVVEEPEGGSSSWETLRADDVPGGQRSAGEDVPAEDEDVKTEQCRKLRILYPVDERAEKPTTPEMYPETSA
ncbi:cadherin-related family member 5 [Cololabis saira]|uniref:cadherin-related family member 5 n=1 Tax=Cololabis saira TaxID=129043 RepID=UPI002AD5A553|nr:cadherin-related family member 5 [Cololabis saira]